MNLFEYWDKQIPEYYPTMYMDGYTPTQILYSAHRKNIDRAKERRTQQEQQQEALDITRVNITYKNIKK